VAIGWVIASCAPADALLPDGKPIAVLCKRVEQSTTDASGAAGLSALSTSARQTTLMRESVDTEVADEEKSTCTHARRAKSIWSQSGGGAALRVLGTATTWSSSSFKVFGRSSMISTTQIPRQFGKSSDVNGGRRTAVARAAATLLLPFIASVAGAQMQALNDDEFWAVIDALRAATSRRNVDHVDALTSILRKETPERIAAFDQALTTTWRKINTGVFVAAAHVAQGGVSDDGLEYFQ
jgi:hypothetical protein